MSMIERRSWAEFRASGLLWWVNRSLHLFGWALVVEMDGDAVKDCYPGRCKFRGFTPDVDNEGFITLTDHLRATAETLANDLRES